MNINFFGIKVKRKARKLSPFKDGHIRRSIRKRNKVRGFQIIFKVSEAKHTVFQQEGFRHHISGKMVNKNKGFIDNIVAEIIQMAVIEVGGSKKDSTQTTRDLGFKRKSNGNRVS